jgi:hypothetical protein
MKYEKKKKETKLGVQTWMRKKRSDTRSEVGPRA